MKIELISTEDRGRYLVSHPAEIERILREVMDGKNIVALYGENGKQFLLSTLVAVEPEKNYLLFEQGVDDAMNALLQIVGCTLEQASYMGDDVIDLPVMRRCGFAAWQRVNWNSG